MAPLSSSSPRHATVRLPSAPPARRPSSIPPASTLSQPEIDDEVDDDEDTDDLEIKLTANAMKALTGLIKQHLDHNKKALAVLITQETARLKRELRGELKDLVREVIREENLEQSMETNHAMQTRADEIAVASLLSSPKSAKAQALQLQLADVLTLVKNHTAGTTRDVTLAVTTVQNLSVNMEKKVKNIDDKLNHVADSSAEVVDRINLLSQWAAKQWEMVQKRDGTLQTVLGSADDHFAGLAGRMGSLVDKLDLQSRSQEANTSADSTSSRTVSIPPASASAPPPRIGRLAPPIAPARPSGSTKSFTERVYASDFVTIADATPSRSRPGPTSSQQQSQQVISLEDDSFPTQTDDTLVSQSNNASTQSTQQYYTPQASFDALTAPKATPRLEILSTPPTKNRNGSRAPVSGASTSSSPAPESTPRRSGRATKKPQRLGSSGLLSQMQTKMQLKQESPPSAPTSRGTKRGATDMPTSRSQKRTKTSSSPPAVLDDDGSVDDNFKDDMKNVKWPELLPEPADGEEMLQCEGCERWFHAGCVGLTPAQVQKLQDTKEVWGCPICAADGISRRRSSRSGPDGGEECPRPGCKKGKETYVIGSVIGRRWSRAEDDDEEKDYEYLVTWDGWDLKWSEWKSENMPIMKTQTSQDLIIEFVNFAKQEGIPLHDGGDIKMLSIAEDSGFDHETGELRVQTRKRRYRR
ncbi:hypothetical protein CALVIDRAFT_539253 [Calocera viscosa TUFC12733]|uniref:PHD-type domain-containing protein n=1 Tax=Calocera viscosa (strain TUFC12733) TaxID=1330018 RepID=A0A167K2Y5_CALVF|nr:hypothetical protein CALVIDRAFT_539253 [Calocera viscosa TUFC12733]